MIRRSWIAVAWALGLLAGFSARELIALSRAQVAPALRPFQLGGESLLLPEGAHRSSAASPDSPPEASWAPAAAGGTRCGARESVRLLPLGPGQPRAVLCGMADPFQGASSEGDCPRTSVCTAARGARQLVCESDRGACPAIAAAFAGTR